MSDEAEHTLNIEEAVVGEPAHQADVVGLESHDDTARKPLGLKDQKPVVSAVAPSDGIEVEVPAQKVSDISQSPELGTPNLPEERMTQAHEQDVQTREDSLGESTKQSDAGNFSSLSSHAKQVSGVNEATGEGGSLTPDASTQGPLAQLDDSKDDPSFSDIVEDSVITHIEESPVEAAHPVSEVTSGNPYLALDKPSIPEDSIKEQPVVQNQSLDVARIANEAPLADSTLIKSEDSQEEYNVVDVKQQEATDTIEEPIERKANNNAEGQFEPTIEAKSTSKGEPEMEEETMKGLQQKNDVLLQDSHASDASPVEEADVTGDDTVVARENNVSVEEQKVGPGVESFQDSQEDVAMLKGAPLLQSLTTENGEGNHGMDHEGDRELSSKNDDKGAEGKEKESSSVKFTLVVTGVAFAAVGVALASFHRSH